MTMHTTADCMLLVGGNITAEDWTGRDSIIKVRTTGKDNIAKGQFDFACWSFRPFG